MAKKKTKTPIPVVNTTPTYQVGQELIYSDHRTMLDKVKVTQVKENGYILSNGVMVNFDLNRTNSRVFEGHCIIANEEGLAIYEAYNSQQKIIRALSDIEKMVIGIDKMNLTPEAAQRILKVNKYINKIKSTLEDV